MCARRKRSQELPVSRRCLTFQRLREEIKKLPLRESPEMVTEAEIQSEFLNPNPERVLINYVAIVVFHVANT